jgi:drug/metabolite transporter (DMT)-like permease
VLAVALALASAVSYGVADFLAGVAARRDTAIRVTLLVYGAGLVAMVFLLPWMARGNPSPSALAWGALSGTGLAAEALALAAGFRRAPFSIAGPLSAVVGGALAVLVGVLLGERPSGLAWAGVLLALPAIAAVSASGSDADRHRVGGPFRAEDHLIGVAFGLGAGLGFAVSLVGLSQTTTLAGIWPVAAMQTAAFLTVATVAAITGNIRWPVGSSRGPSSASGLLGAWAGVFYLLALHDGPLAVIAVITALFPAVTVALAVCIAGERLGRIRLSGLLVAAIAVALIAAGSPT